MCRPVHGFFYAYQFVVGVMGSRKARRTPCPGLSTRYVRRPKFDSFGRWFLTPDKELRP